MSDYWKARMLPQIEEHFSQLPPLETALELLHVTAQAASRARRLNQIVMPDTDTLLAEFALIENVTEQAIRHLLRLQALQEPKP